MIKVKELNKFSPKVRQYLLTNLLITIIFLSVVFSISGNNNFFGTFFTVAIIIGLPFYIYISLMYNSWSFFVNENDITINSGILVKKSKTIPFNMIQNINRKQGILMGMFGITNMDIWTSSPSQININEGKTLNKPDGNIVLTNEDADWLQGFMTYSPDSEKKNYIA